jgi:hypothetical protein
MQLLPFDSQAGQRDLRLIAGIQGSLALLYLEEKQRNQAQHAAHEALAAAERLGHASLQANALLLLASCRKHTNSGVRQRRVTNSPLHLRLA